MERKVRKAINFDLDTKKMKALKVYPNGYTALKSTFAEYGFSHRQGSGYISAERLDSDQINDIIAGVLTKHSWLKECVNKIDVTDIGRQHDLISFVKLFDIAEEEL